MKIVISNNVKFAIDDIFDYSAQISIKYAISTLNNLYKTIIHIQEAPYIGRYVAELSNKHFRERLYKQFRIIYYISDVNQTIYIQYIFSNKKNPSPFFKVHKNEISRFLKQFPT